MDKLTKYQQEVEAFLQEEANIPISNKGLERQIIADHKRNHYQLLVCGWEGSKYVYSIQIHLDIKPNGKIWIQQNWTELQITDELMARGVAKDDIVLGFIPEYERSYTGFAIS
jgi:hypothetical protein